MESQINRISNKSKYNIILNDVNIELNININCSNDDKINILSELLRNNIRKGNIIIKLFENNKSIYICCR